MYHLFACGEFEILGTGNYITSFPTLEEAMSYVDTNRQPSLKRAEIAVVSGGKLRRAAYITFGLFHPGWDIIDITPDAVHPTST